MILLLLFLCFDIDNIKQQQRLSNTNKKDNTIDDTWLLRRLSIDNKNAYSLNNNL